MVNGNRHRNTACSLRLTMKKNKYPDYEELIEQNRVLKNSLSSCENKLRAQKQVITNIQESLELKNKALDAMHWVWCSGGCNSGVLRYTSAKLTEELVRLAEYNTKRLRRWYGAHLWKKAHRLATPEELGDFHAMPHEQRQAWVDDILSRR